MSRQATLFDGARLQMTDSIRFTVDSLSSYGPSHDHWAVAWSGGKDSTCALTVTLYLLESGQVPAPKTLDVLQADTRMEILPLWLTARSIREEVAEHADALAARGCELRVQTVMAPIAKRFWPYILGRGVPPPNNGRLRWCTRQIKVDPMQDALAALREERGTKTLVITGVRLGESAVRDARIALSCSRDGGECGQGWYQQTLPESLCDTLAPILHWRICHVWEWLDGWAPKPEFGDWSTRLLAQAYGGRDGNEAEEIGARTGCVCCPLASRDSALAALVARPQWTYLATLFELRSLWDELRSPARRLRQPGGERRRDGSLASNQHRLGPLTIDGRRWALERVLSIQGRVNAAADAAGQPRIDMLDAEEEAFIRSCHDSAVWPDGWDGDEPLGDEPFEDGGQLLITSLVRRA